MRKLCVLVAALAALSASPAAAQPVSPVADLVPDESTTFAGDEAAMGEEDGGERDCDSSEDGGRRGCRGGRNANRWFNCNCNGSYKFPVPPLYTYHWPGLYSMQRMTDYHSPWRFPALKPYEDETPVRDLTRSPEFRQVQATTDRSPADTDQPAEERVSAVARRYAVE